MNIPTNNRTLAFFHDFGIAVKFIWHELLLRLARVSWWKMFFVSLLVFLVAGMFEIANTVGLIILVAMGIKLFTPRRYSTVIPSAL